jgi:hypothetical protein
MTTTDEPQIKARFPRPGKLRPGRPALLHTPPGRSQEETVAVSIPIPEHLRLWAVRQPEGLASVARQALLREHWRREGGGGCRLTGDEE